MYIILCRYNLTMANWKNKIVARRGQLLAFNPNESHVIVVCAHCTIATMLWQYLNIIGHFYNILKVVHGATIIEIGWHYSLYLSHRMLFRHTEIVTVKNINPTIDNVIFILFSGARTLDARGGVCPARGRTCSWNR